MTTFTVVLVVILLIIAALVLALRIRRVFREAPWRAAGKLADKLVAEGDVDAMAEHIRHEGFAHRLAGVLALAASRKRAAEPHLIAALGDRQYEVRLIAVRALANAGGEKALAVIADRGVADSSPLVRSAAISALVGARSEDAVVPLTRALKIAADDPAGHPMEAEALCDALADLGFPTAIAMLSDVAASPYAPIATAAKNALEVIRLKAEVAKNPDDVEAVRHLGAVYMSRNKPAAAMPHLEQARQLAPDDLSTIRALAAVYAALDETDKAIRAYRRVIELAPSDAEPHRLLGVLLESEGERAKAVESYQRYLELAPAGDQAADVRKRLAALER